MRRALLVAVVALLLIVGAVAVLAPATLVAPIVDRASAGKVTTSNLEGSLWRGRGTFGTASARLPVAWTLEPMPLFTGQVALHLAPAAGDGRAPRGNIKLGRGRAALRDVVIELPAGAIADALARSASLRAAVVVDGTVEASTPQLDWTPPSSSGDLRIVWRGARLTVLAAPPVDLGDLVATLRATGDRLAGPVANTGGDLDVRGEVALTAGGATSASLLLTPRRTADDGLARALSALGTPDGAGWRVTWPPAAR